MKDVPPRETLRYYAASDHAVAIGQDNDSTCLMTVAVDQSDNIWVMPDIFWDKSPTNIVVEAMINQMATYKPLYWWAERGQISKAIGPFLRKRMLERQTFCTVDEVQPVSDKQQRAQSIQARMAMGKVFFPRFAQWWSKAENQILKFPLGIHDDLVDTLSLIGLGLSRQFGRRKEKKPGDTGMAQEMTFGRLIANSNRSRRQTQVSKELQGW